MAGFVLSKGALTTKTNTEGEIRKQRSFVTAAGDRKLLPTAATESLKESQDDIKKLEDKVKHETSLPSWRRSKPKSTAALTTQPTSIPPPPKKPDEVGSRNGPHM